MRCRHILGTCHSSLPVGGIVGVHIAMETCFTGKRKERDKNAPGRQATSTTSHRRHAKMVNGDDLCMGLNAPNIP